MRLFEEMPEYGRIQYYNPDYGLGPSPTRDAAQMINYCYSIGLDDQQTYDRVYGKMHRLIDGEIYKPAEDYWRLGMEYYKKYYIERNQVVNRAIFVPKSVLDEIHAINNITIEHILFIAYCVYKVYGLPNPKGYQQATLRAILTYLGLKATDDIITSLVPIEAEGTIFEMQARIIRYRNRHHYLMNMVLTDRFLSLGENDTEGVAISNFVNLWMYYDNYFKLYPVFYCHTCGAIQRCPKNGGRHWYCKPCAKTAHYITNSTVKRNKERQSRGRPSVEK